MDKSWLASLLASRFDQFALGESQQASHVESMLVAAGRDPVLLRYVREIHGWCVTFRPGASRPVGESRSGRVMAGNPSRVNVSYVTVSCVVSRPVIAGIFIQQKEYK